MLLSVAIVTGFKNEISEKVSGFAGHIKISKYDSNASFESAPIEYTDSLKQMLLNIDGVTHVQSVSTKAGIMQANDELLGIVLKGVGLDFDSAFC